MEKSRQIYQKFRKIKYFFKKYPRLRLGLRHLRYHKLKHRFLDSLNRICSSGFDIETTSHFILHCQNFINERSLQLNNVSGLTKEKLPSCDMSVIKLFLYGDDSLDLVRSTLILNASVDFILPSKRFDGPFYRIIIYVVNNTLKKLQLKHFFLFQLNYFFLLFLNFYFLLRCTHILKELGDCKFPV